MSNRHKCTRKRTRQCNITVAAHLQTLDVYNNSHIQVVWSAVGEEESLSADKGVAPANTKNSNDFALCNLHNLMESSVHI